MTPEEKISIEDRMDLIEILEDKVFSLGKEEKDLQDQIRELRSQVINPSGQDSD